VLLPHPVLQALLVEPVLAGGLHEGVQLTRLSQMARVSIHVEGLQTHDALFSSYSIKPSFLLEFLIVAEVSFFEFFKICHFAVGPRRKLRFIFEPVVVLVVARYNPPLYCSR